MVDFASAFSSKVVLITGHTGFKGSWLSEWLLSLGAKVVGFALPPPTDPALFDQLGLADRMQHIVGDIRHPEAIAQTIHDTQPDFVFHLAAQPLVRLSYREPLETWQTNVLGTLNVLQALRSQTKECTTILITTDKVYENREWNHSYREEDHLGGYDPYSSSKAAAEIGVSAWHRSFFPSDHPVKIATARAGNVIGGGDWAEDRIVPDAIRALAADRPIAVRNPASTRPWQHVLEPLSGYLQLAAALAHEPLPSSAFNFGPTISSNRPVEILVEEILRSWPGSWTRLPESNPAHEAGKLNLSTDLAYHLLDWQPRWDFPTTIRRTVEWYREALADPKIIPSLTRRQISEYSLAA